MPRLPSMNPPGMREEDLYMTEVEITDPTDDSGIQYFARFDRNRNITVTGIPANLNDKRKPDTHTFTPSDELYDHMSNVVRGKLAEIKIKA